MIIKNNIDKIRQAIPEGCTLVVVSKTHPIEKIQEVYTTGHRIFGENKVQELVAKYEALPNDIQWHLIGHLQTNKVKYVTPFVHLIQSVDSVRLLQEINKQAIRNKRVVHCLLQVHIAQEETKFGFSTEEVLTFVASAELSQLQSVKIVGLMGMATYTEDVGQIRKEFQILKNLFDTLKKINLPTNMSMQELSMGMSSDYTIAIEEGSTMVRVGSAIFGERNYTLQ